MGITTKAIDSGIVKTLYFLPGIYPRVVVQRHGLLPFYQLFCVFAQSLTKLFVFLH